MKNVIKDLTASSAVSWGTIAEKIDENFNELENSIPQDGGLDESQLKEYLKQNEYVTKNEIPEIPQKVSELENDAKYATENQLEEKQDTLKSGVNIKTVNGKSLLGEGNIEIQTENASSKKHISILFVGNSLTQDGIAYLPYMLKTYYPEVDFKIYMWYIGGSTLGGHYSTFTSGGKAEIFSVAENTGTWTNYSKSVTMASVLSTYSFDVVSMQEYFNYKTEYKEVTDWNRCRDYIVSNYKGGNALEFISLFHAPLRKDGSNVDEVFERIQAGNALILQETISQDMIPNGIAVYRALETDLNNLGDLGQLSPDGTHTQEGLPCLLQTFVTLCWLFEKLGINKSVYGSPMRMTSAIYNTLSIPGANLGKGVVTGTDAQNLLAQEVAIKAYKEGKQFVMRNIYPYAWGGGSITTQCTFSITANVSDATIKINGIEQSSVVVPSGSTVNWEVYKDGYYTQSGSDIVTSDMAKYVELELEINVASISAEFIQGERTIFDNEDIDNLKKYLTVTATYEDGTVEETNDYTLTGNLYGGICTINVSYGRKETTFEVYVTAFEMPEDYERYGYIEKKTTSQTRVALDNFINLKAYEDMNVLSLEVLLGKKPNISTYDGAGLMGSRPASGEGINYYAVYWNEKENIWVGARNQKCDYAIPSDTTKIKLIVDNPEESPLSIQVNDGVKENYEWTNSSVLPYSMTLFNNLPNGSSQTFYINKDTRIGDIILRKANGECVGYYTPVVHEGRIGMYDQISKQFYTSSAVNATTVGNSGCYYAVGNW